MWSAAPSAAIMADLSPLLHYRLLSHREGGFQAAPVLVQQELHPCCCGRIQALSTSLPFYLCLRVRKLHRPPWVLCLFNLLLKGNMLAVHKKKEDMRLKCRTYYPVSWKRGTYVYNSLYEIPRWLWSGVHRVHERNLTTGQKMQF